jgi:hypothetical protein
MCHTYADSEYRKEYDKKFYEHYEECNGSMENAPDVPPPPPDPVNVPECTTLVNCLCRSLLRPPTPSASETTSDAEWRPGYDELEFAAWCLFRS